MKEIGLTSRVPDEHTSNRGLLRLAEIVATIALLLVAGKMAAQDAPAAPANVQDGYEIHQTADLGGHLVGVSGSGAMYDTLVNIHSGPRVLGETFTMHALPGTKPALFDSLTAFSNGFGGDPLNFAKLDVSKGKLYEFTGTFRRDRQYFDYDLLGNPNSPGTGTVPIGPAGATTGLLVWGTVNQSPFLMNTVRRMTNADLTLLPLSKITIHVAYYGNTFEGPGLSPSYNVGKNNALLEQYQRNSTDNFTGTIDWKPVQQTKLTYEEQVDHYKGDTFFTLNPNGFRVQEADGTPVYLGAWDNTTATPYSTTSCNTNSMTTPYTILSAPATAGGLPILNPACDGITSYIRSQPIRALFPTEIFRMQSSSLRAISMNGDFRFTNANFNIPHYYESYQGLNGVIRSATWTGNTTASRDVVAADYAIAWQPTQSLEFSDQVNYSNAHQPGLASISTGVTVTTPATANNETINYSGPFTAGTSTITGNPNGTPAAGYFSQKFVTNNATATWYASGKATVSLTYRFQYHNIVQNAGASFVDAVAINENAGVLNIALRPTSAWQINGTAEIGYSDNAMTPVDPRQLTHFRVHTLYRPKPWVTLSGAFNDMERHNNTNNLGVVSVSGPVGHEDHNRILAAAAEIAKDERIGFEANYVYSDVYATTNICYLSGATATLPGTASTTSSGAPNLCVAKSGDWGPVADFMDAPTEFVSFGVLSTPVKAIHVSAGYRISAVSGNQFFEDAQAVNGSLQSAWQTPYATFTWNVHKGLAWRAEYQYSGYGEGGPSGAPFCSNSTSATAVVVACNSSTLVGPTGVTEPSSGLTAPRNFHANNLTLAMHYEF